MSPQLALALLSLLPKLSGSKQLDGVSVPTPSPEEYKGFIDWMQQNKVREPFHPDQHYDYVGAYRAGEGRGADSQHFTDTFKLPGHETFSDESSYAVGENAKKAGHWDGDRYIPASKKR